MYPIVAAAAHGAQVCLSVLNVINTWALCFSYVLLLAPYVNLLLTAFLPANYGLPKQFCHQFTQQRPQDLLHFQGCHSFLHKYTSQPCSKRRFFDAPGALDDVLSTSDVTQIVTAPTPPLAVLELLTAHITAEIVPKAGLLGSQLLGAFGGVVAAYGDCERIKDFPIILSYIAHLRVLLCAYLLTLPLALVESMGFATIIVHWVVSYALMSLEELAVDCENPFDGQGKSDLRLLEQCDLIKEQSLESWQRWIENCEKPLVNWQEEPYTQVLVGE